VGGKTTKEVPMNLPEVVSAEEWQRARGKLLAAEKAHMREGDRIAPERRRQPMVGYPTHLHARDTTFVLVSRASPAKLVAFRRRMGWDEIPWYSDGDSDFGVDFGFSPPEPLPDQDQDGEVFGFNVFVRDDDGRVYRTYFTNWRGVEAIGSVWSILDRTPLGRQEEWEDTPEGRPQGPKFEWWRHHDRYGTAAEPT
jgi:predicted dithiol-disulfide oxidoreductase (DUF899 family)